VIQSQSVADRNACLNTARQQLIELEREHAAIYLNQIRSLKPDHPVMKTLLNRLRDNRDLAALAIDTDAEPSQLISMRKEACLHSSKR
jgi:ABC-type glutathione transport system ATPase component